MTPPCLHSSPVAGCTACAHLTGHTALDAAYRALWEAQAQGVASPDLSRVQRPCRHAGGETGEALACPSCRGAVRVKVLDCAIHGRRTAVKPLPGLVCCGTCPDYDPRDPFRGPPVRDLAYHVYPLRAAPSAWRWNVRQLLRRVALFNGRRVVAVSVDHRTEHPSEVLEAFGGEIDPGDLLVVDNEPGAPESKTWPLLLSRLATDDPDRCLLRAHAKGVTRDGTRDGAVVRRWTETLYEAMLDFWPVVEEQLTAHPVTGCFRCRWQQWPQEAPGSRWFYSGSWAWYRSRHLFSRRWRDVPRFWAGVEALPSLLYGEDEAGCLFADHSGVCYSADAWKQLGPAFDVWATANAHRRSNPAPVRDLENEVIPNAKSTSHLVCVLTENYVPRARTFLASLARVRSARRWVACLGFNPGTLAAEFPWITFRRMERHWSESFGMLQTGRWLDVLPEVRDEDVVILSDADVDVQRDLDAGERAALDALDGNTFLAAWNAHEGDHLALEACRIALGDDGFYGGVYRLQEIPCFNCGVLAARPPAWRVLRDCYEPNCSDFYARSSHRSRCQWLINWCFRAAGLKVVPLPPATHAQGHFGTPPGVSFRGGAACVGETLVMFRHALGGMGALPAPAVAR